MRKQNCCCPDNQMCCPCKGYQNDFAPVIRSPSYKESSSTQDECLPCKCKNNPSKYKGAINESVDRHAKNGSSTFRQKTSRFMKSDSGCSIETEASIKDIAYPPPHSYHEPSAFNQSGSSLKRAEAPRSYSPKSEFLKKLKYPCYCAENKQQRQSIPPNSNSCSDFIPKVCEECIIKSNQIIELLEQLNNHTVNAVRQFNEKSRRFQSSTDRSRAETNTLNRAEEITRNFANQLRNVLTSAPPYQENVENEEFYDDNYLPQDLDDNQYLTPNNYPSSYYRSASNKKKKSASQHVSRSKKRVKCRGRRKRKSNDSEKCYSQDYFEPTLKKPHENSCERCWRYASPSRSPVNKPDQRFDPNFRKAHSFHDLTVNESDGDEPNIEINEKSPFPKNAYPTELSRITELSSARSQYQSPVRGYSNMREKDVSFENPPPRPNWNEIQKDRTYEKNDRYNTMNLSDRERSMRFSPGKGQFGVMDELGNTQYKETRYRSPNSTKQSTELRNIERPNSYYLRKENRIDSQFPDASLRSPVNMHAEGRSETPQYKMKPCLECHCASSNKNQETALAFATPTRSKPSPKTNSVRLSRSGTIIGTPRPHHSNKYHSKRSESPKNDVANTRHSHIDEYIPSKKTQSSASPKHRRGGSFELRPPTPNLERQSGVDSRDRNPSPRSRRTSELNELGVRCCYCHRNSPKLQPEKRCCYCHRNSPKLQPEIFTNPYESPKKVKHHRNHSSPRRTSYDANASFMTPPAFNSTPYDYSLPPPPPPQWSPVLRNCPENFYEFNNSLPCKHQSLPFDSVPYCPGQTICFPRRCYTVNTALCEQMKSPFTKDATHGRKNKNGKDSNGKDSNGKDSNGKDSNGKDSNGKDSNGKDSNGKNSNGKDPNGKDSNGKDSNGKDLNGKNSNANFPQNVPKKYCVLYMTKNLGDKGNDVEVLVEEVTEANQNSKKKDSKIEAVEEKMKKIQECPLESMALKFQKGVSESVKTPENSRTLYF